MSNINNTKDNVVFEQNTNESANQQQQSTKPSFKEIYDKYFGIKVNPDYGKPHAPKTKLGYYVRQFDIGVQRFYRSMVRTVNSLVNLAVKLSVVGIFLILLSWYCQQNPEFAVQLQNTWNSIVVAVENAWDMVMAPIQNLFH